MDNVPPEILLDVFEKSVESLRELFSLRTVFWRFRNLIDGSCKQFGLRLARIQSHAFDDALTAVRIKRIPWEGNMPIQPPLKDLLISSLVPVFRGSLRRHIKLSRGNSGY